MYLDFDQSFATLGRVKTPISRSKTWAYQDSNKSPQVISISILRLIIRKTWAYQLRHNQSFARLGLIKIPINHSQDVGISRLRSIVHKNWAYQVSDQSFARLGHIQTYAHYELDMPVLPMIDQSLVNDYSKYGYSKVLQMIDRSPDIPKSCK